MRGEYQTSTGERRDSRDSLSPSASLTRHNRHIMEDKDADGLKLSLLSLLRLALKCFQSRQCYLHVLTVVSPAHSYTADDTGIGFNGIAAAEDD